MFLKKKVKTTPWNVLDYLKTDEEIACYLETAVEEHDHKYLRIAVKDAVEALRSRNARHIKMRKRAVPTKKTVL